MRRQFYCIEVGMAISGDLLLKWQTGPHNYPVIVSTAGNKDSASGSTLVR